MFFLLSIYLIKKLFLNISEILFYSNIVYYSWVSALLFIYLSIKKQKSNVDTIWISSKCFLYCLLSNLFAAKDVNVKNVYIGSIKSFCIGDTYTRNIYTRSNCIKIIFSTLSTYIKNASFNSTSIKDTNKKTAYARNIYSIKSLKIHLQSFLILEIELFDTD